MGSDFVTEKWYGLWWRIPICVMFLGLGLWLGSRAIAGGGWGAVGGLLIAAAGLLSATIVVATPLADGAAHALFGVLGGLVYPDRQAKRPAPMYSPAEARRMEGRYKEAIAAYEAILKEYPGDGRSYLALMDIAWQDLHDARLAMDFYRRGEMAVTDKAYLDEMRQAYEVFVRELPGWHGD
jgi:tetratricopeptide (TPR) repeat protein